jgi:hypothetical protein
MMNIVTTSARETPLVVLQPRLLLCCLVLKGHVTVVVQSNAATRRPYARSSLSSAQCSSDGSSVPGLPPGLTVTEVARIHDAHQAVKIARNRSRVVRCLA